MVCSTSSLAHKLRSSKGFIDVHPGILQDVQVSIPSLDDEMDDPFEPKGPVPVGDIEMDLGDDSLQVGDKGKRKAPSD